MCNHTRRCRRLRTEKHCCFAIFLAKRVWEKTDRISIHLLLDCNVMFVGTGDCYLSLSFYKSCGFKESHRVKNFFVDNYDHLMFEDGVQLVDMVYLKWER